MLLPPSAFENKFLLKGKERLSRLCVFSHWGGRKIRPHQEKCFCCCSCCCFFFYLIWFLFSYCYFDIKKIMIRPVAKFRPCFHRIRRNEQINGKITGRRIASKIYRSLWRPFRGKSNNNNNKKRGHQPTLFWEKRGKVWGKRDKSNDWIPGRSTTTAVGLVESVSPRSIKTLVVAAAELLYNSRLRDNMAAPECTKLDVKSNQIFTIRFDVETGKHKTMITR